MLNELEKKLAQVQNSLLKKEVELEEQHCLMRELEITFKEKARIELGALQAEIQKLSDALEDSKQQHRLAGEAPTGPSPAARLLPKGLQQPPVSHGPLELLTHPQVHLLSEATTAWKSSC